MHLPRPQFEMGQTIYIARYTMEEKEIPCPDCNDTRIWNVTTASGLAFEVPCQRCSKYDFCVPKVTEEVFEPAVTESVIVEIRYRTGRDGDLSISYSSLYSSGSGENWFSSHEMAMRHAQELADKEKAQFEARNAERIERNRKIGKSHLEKALALHLSEQLAKAEAKYERAIAKIVDLKDEYIHVNCRTGSILYRESVQEAAARHLLSELDESIPDEWGDY